MRHQQSSGALRLGFDYRAALHNREGIGRAQRASLAALRGYLLEKRPDARLALFAATLRPPQVPAAERLQRSDVSSWFGPRLPARWAYPLTRALGGVSRWLGGLDLFQGLATQPLWPGSAIHVATLYDLLFLEGPGEFLAAPAAARMARGLERSLATLARLQVPSAHVAREVVRRLGFPAERIDLVPLGGDGLLQAHELPTPLPRGRFVLTVGRLDPRKNLDRGLRAFELVARSEPDLTWILAGPAGYQSEMVLKDLRASPCAARIEWRGAVSDGVLKHLYSRCSAFFFPSLAEGFGLPPLEARCLGAPVAAANTTSLPEFLSDSGCHLADPRDELALAEALGRALAQTRATLPAYSGPTWASGAEAQWRAIERALGSGRNSPE